MNRRSKVARRLALLFLLGLVSPSGPVQGYVPMRWGSGGVYVKYAPDRLPLVFQVNAQTAQGTPNMAPGSNPLAAIRAASAAWQEIPTASVRFSDLQLTSLESADPGDGINLITMADTAANRQLLGSDRDTGTLALTRVIFSISTGKISESDITFNPKYNFSTTLAPGTFDLQAIITHELGHALGCDHSVAQNDTMFFLIGERQFWQRDLSVDAIAFASFTYPYPGRSAETPTFSGHVIQDGKGLFGASVTATNLDRNLIYTTMAESDGSYVILDAIPGRYVIYAEPLDGPVTPEQLLGSGAGDGYYEVLQTGFRATFAESEITIENSGAKEVNLEIPSAPAALNINRMGRGDPDTGTGHLGVGPVPVNPGDQLLLMIGGPNTWKVAGADGVHILGTGIEIVGSRGVRVVNDESGAEAGISVLVQVAPDAAPGPRTVTLEVEGEKVASTGGIVVTARSLPAQTLYLPYFQTSPGQYTGLAMANPSSQSAVVRVTARDNNGGLVYSRGAIVPRDLSLGPGTQIAQVDRQLFNLPADFAQSGSITIESDAGPLGCFFLTGDIGGTSLNGATAFTRAYAQLQFVDVLQNGSTATEIHLMNVKDTPETVKLSLVGANGAILRGPLTRTIPARGKIGESVSSLFSYSGTLSAAHVKATASEETLVGFAFVRLRGATFGLNAQPQESAAGVLYSPHLAVGNFGVEFTTRLNIVNVGDSEAWLMLYLLGDDGQPLPGINTGGHIKINAGGHFTVDAKTYFGLAGKGRIQGSIKIQSTTPEAKLLGNIVFGDGDPAATRLSFGAALPLTAVGEDSFLLSQVAQGRGYYSGLALMAPDGADIAIRVFRPDGSIAGSALRTLAPGARLSALLDDLIPASAGQLGGYVNVSSTKPVIGFELFGSTQGQFLAAVSPQKQ